MGNDISTDAGRLFEAGFMVGVVREIATLPQPPQSLLEHYQSQCGSYHLPGVLDVFAKYGGASRESRERMKTLGQYYFFKGFLSGYSFMREYFDACRRRNGIGARRQTKTMQQLHIVYWQCMLIGKNRLEQPSLQEESQEQAFWLSAFPSRKATPLPADTKTGGFLQADLLLLLHDGLRDDYLVLVVDPSAFGPRDFHRRDLARGRELLHMLHRDVRYLLEKGAFSRLEIEAGGSKGTLFTKNFTKYFSAFATSDRESVKVIQAGSYAHGFTHFLRHYDLIPIHKLALYHVAGYSDRGLTMLTLGADDTALLAACSHIYSIGKKQERAAQPEEGTAPYQMARIDVLNYLNRHVAGLFKDGRKLTRQLHDGFHQVLESVQLTPLIDIDFDETLYSTTDVEGRAIDFQGMEMPLSAEVLARYQLLVAPPQIPHIRWAHTQLVYRAMADAQRRYAFLTGNPGIGKTTALSTYLRTICQEDGYLLLYASPRKTVNRDIFEKFRTPSGEYDGVHFLGLTSNSDMIDLYGKRTILYVGSAENLPPQSEDGIVFITEDELRLRQAARPASSYRPASAITETTLQERNTKRWGVISTLSKGIGEALRLDRTNTLVAAVALQALKLRTTSKGDTDTLEHLFRGIFRDAYLPEAQQSAGHYFIDATMRQLASHTKHLIIMIDEITGDDAGYAFLNRIAELLTMFQLEHYGFNVKIVVADASLTDKEVVKTHLRLHNDEPDARKIYVGAALHSAKVQCEPIQAETFAFDTTEGTDAWIINTNAFPASRLHLRYRIHVPMVTIPSHTSLQKQASLFSPRSLDNQMDKAIEHDICDFLNMQPPSEQAIVYIQNKQRLARLIEAIQKHEEHYGRQFERGQHYMEIHAEISEEMAVRVQNEEQRGQYRVFFITSSASRGLTFAQTKFLFIDVPRFHIEAQLMEILQVMYRGRGQPNDSSEKTITFYLSDRLFFDEEEPVEVRRLRIQEEQLDVTTMLALLKMCILSRIAGQASFQDQAYSVIPIGGKSLATAGRALHYDLAGLQHAIRNELNSSHHRHDKALLQLEQTLKVLLEEVEITIPAEENSLLRLYDHLSPTNLTKWMFNANPLPDVYIYGSLIIVPISGKQKTQTAHHMSLTRAIEAATSEETLSAIRTVFARHGQYAPAIHQHIRALDGLVNELLQVNHSQRLDQNELLRDGYYVIPIATFLAKDPIRQWCEELQEADPGGERDLLKQDMILAMRASYPLDTILPIGSHYRRFPYLVVTSRDFMAMRRRIWNHGHVFLSREMNLLTMLLAQHDIPPG